MKRIILILLIFLPLCSCGCNFANRAPITGICVEKNNSDNKIAGIAIEAFERICDSEDPLVYTDENGRFSIDQCFEEDDEGEDFSVTVNAFYNSTYETKKIIYKYKGQSVIDLGEIPLEKY